PSAGAAAEGASRRAALPSLAAVVGRVEPPLALPKRSSAPRTAAGPTPQAGAERGPATVFRKMKVEELAVPRSYRVIARLLALAPAILLVVVLLGVPDFLVLPFPWQDGQRLALAQAQRAPLYLKIDRAAKTYFLLEGRFPERLSQLQQAGLLAGEDLHDPQGYALRYAAREEGYVVQPVDGKGTPIAGAESTEAITGNFLLDPDFISVSPDHQAPLVLID
ncbi:MAG TPA: hypothetical protein VOA87_15990, partial [Thermoanaerobaculia bacterium]|nr:hypothetical protein [Thermoanaerobaculia bacterium]